MTIDTTRLRADAEAVRDAGVKLRTAREADDAAGTAESSDAYRSAAKRFRAAQRRLYADAPPDGIILALLDELTAACEALGAGWLTGGVTLAEGIERKTCALEGLNVHELLTPADPMLPTVAVPRDLVEAIVEDLRQGLAIERETGEALAELLEGGAA